METTVPLFSCGGAPGKLSYLNPRRFSHSDLLLLVVPGADKHSSNGWWVAACRTHLNFGPTLQSGQALCAMSRRPPVFSLVAAAFPWSTTTDGQASSGGNVPVIPAGMILLSPHERNTLTDTRRWDDLVISTDAKHAI